jgi:protein involved in polysaccharide export with SLBB domain
MDMPRKTAIQVTTLLSCYLLICCASGCSSLGLSPWPSQFPLLQQTKEMAAASPLPAGMPHELSKFELPNYFIEPGDRILIEPVSLESDISSLGDQKVQIDGSIDLGKYGRIRVVGMTVEQIEQVVEDQIALFGERESINVKLVETNAAEVYVIGEVGSPAAYPIDGHEHVLDAILRAGGLTSKASPCDIILVRPTEPNSCRVVLPVCYRQITQIGDVTTNYQLQPGDRIVVGSRTLREELSLRKQRKSCDRCCRSTGVECQPTRVQYRNRFAALLPSFALPNTEADNEKKLDGSIEPQQPASSADAYYLPEPSQNQKATGSDDDIFLPSLKPNEFPEPGKPKQK